MSSVVGSGGLTNTSTMFDNFIPEVWTKGVQYYFPRNLILGSLAMDWSSLVAQSGDKIHIPRINELSTGEKSQGSAVATWTHNTTAEGEDVLSIDKHTYSGMLVEDIATTQANDDLLSKYTQQMAYALAKKVDEALEAELQSNTTNVIEMSGTGDTAGKIQKGDFSLIVKTLLEADIDYLNDVYIVLTPAIYSTLFELDDFARADAVGDSLNHPRVNGFIGTMLGMPIYVSNVVGVKAAADGNAGTTKGYVFHKSALNMAYSIAPRTQSQYDIDYLGTKVVTDASYGCKLITGSTGNTKKAFMIKDAS